MEAPKGKYVFGTVRVGEKGQIVIPKQCRDVFDIHPGDTLVILGDESQGIGIVKEERLLAFTEALFAATKQPITEEEHERH